MEIDKFTDFSQRWRRINALWYKIFMSFLKEKNITYTESIVMLSVHALGEPTKSDVSEYMRSEPQSITRSINSLILKKLLMRNVNDKDKRFAQLILTDSGKKFSAETQNFINKIWSESLTGMNANVLNIFGDQLDNIIKQMEIKI